MSERDKIFKILKSIANNYGIKFECFLGRHYDYGELCVDYNANEGYILFSYDRNEETYHYSTKDIEEFKYTVFKHLCRDMGFEYELKHRLNRSDFPNDDNCFNSDTRKVAFEHTLVRLNSIEPSWMEKAIPEYEKLLNKWHVYFDRDSMEFKESINPII